MVHIMVDVLMKAFEAIQCNVHRYYWDGIPSVLAFTCGQSKSFIIILIIEAAERRENTW